MGPPSKAVKSVARTNSITKEYENFSRKVIEHARGNNDGVRDSRAGFEVEVKCG